MKIWAESEHSLFDPEESDATPGSLCGMNEALTQIRQVRR
jgi:hypothetical protein